MRASGAPSTGGMRLAARLQHESEDGEPDDMGHFLIGVLAAGLALLVALNCPVVEMFGRITAWSESAFDDHPVPDVGPTPDRDEPVLVWPAVPAGLDKG
jgi:hypothetical protein